MSSLRRALPIAALIWALAPVSALAQSGWFVTPFLGVKFGGSTSIVDLELAASDAKTAYGVAGEYVTNGLLGVEAEFAWTPGYLEKGRQTVVKNSNLVDLCGNIIFTLPPSVTRGGLRPYFIAGAGVAHTEAVDVLDIFRIRRSVPVVSLGVGATGLVTNKVGLRFDVRHLHSTARENETLVAIVGRRINYWRASIGIVRRF